MKFCLFSLFQLFGPQKLKNSKRPENINSKLDFFQYFDQFSWKSEVGCFLLFSPKDGHSKITKKIGHPVQPPIFFFAKVKNSSDRIDLNLYFDMKKITVG